MRFWLWIAGLIGVVVLMLGLIYFMADASVKETCIKEGKTYLHADEITFCGDFNDVKAFVKEAVGIQQSQEIK